MAQILAFPGTAPDFIIFRYSHWFDHFFVIAGTVFRSSHEFYLFTVLFRILLFFGTHTNSTVFQYSPGQFFDNRTDSTFSRYLPGLCHFSVLPQSRPFSSTPRDSFSTLVRILPFPGTYSDSAIFRYSHWFDCFPVLSGTTFRHSHGFYLFPVLTRMMPFFGSPTESTLFWYTPGQYFDTRTNSTFSRYWPRFCHFSVFTLIRPFSDTRRDSFLTLVRILPFPGTDPDDAILWYSHIVDPFLVLPGTVFRQLYELYLFPVLTPIQPFFGTHTDSTVFQYSPG